MKRKIFATMLAITMMVSGIPGAAWADEADNADVSVEMSDEAKAIGGDSVTIVESGECGENATYTLDSEGTLVISGSGEMWDYYSSITLTSEKSAVKEIIIGNDITSIGEGAFSGCKNLVEVNIPESVTSIGYGAFWGCSGLTNVNIPESVASIGGCAFWGCSGLTDVMIPKSVTSIGRSTFAKCNKLTNIDVDEENEEYSSLDGVLFSKNQEQILQYPGGKTGTYQIPESVTRIDEYAFSDCIGLMSVNIPESVASIGGCAFWGCSGLTNVNIPESVTNIGYHTFGGCSGLVSVTIPEGVTGISDRMFEGCISLTSVTIPKSVTFIDAYAFEGCIGLTNVTIPEGVTSINNSVFSGCSGLTSMIIPEGVTSISYGAFSGCSRLTSVVIPKGVTNISSDAFQNCKNLTIYCQEDSYAHTYAMQYNIPYRFGQPSTYTISFDANDGTGLTQNSRTVIQGDALGNLPSVTRPGYTFTGWYTAKTGGTAVTKDTVITSNVTVYAQWKANQNLVFEKQSLANAVITLSQTGYSYDGSEKKPAVKSVKLGNVTLKSGTDYTVEYQNNKNIGTATVAITGKGNYIGTATKTFTISAKTGTTITSGAYKYKITGSTEAAFAGLKSSTTKKVTIPKTVNIGGKNFKVTSINTKALQNTKVTSITIGTNVKTIGTSAFAGCSKLSKVTIPNSVTKIGSNAFKNCAALKSVTIPAKVTAIGTGAFSGCKKLTTITVKSTKLKTVGKNAFKGIKSTAKIKVPSKKLTAYQKLLKNKGQGKDVKIIK